jgi:hypothetical protein
MGETLHEFIMRRLQELDAMETPLRAQLDEIRRERIALKKSAKAVGSNIPGATNQYAKENIDNQVKTIKEIVIEVLSKKPLGLTALDILSSINELTGMEYERTSLSPQLSRLKRDGRLKKDGIVWSLKK